MIKAFFTVFTVISIICYGFAGLLLGIHFTDKSAGMIMIFLAPFLVSGLLAGITALVIKRVKKLDLEITLDWLHKLNMMLMLIGIIALIYTFIA